MKLILPKNTKIPIVIGISGGPDSVALLLALVERGIPVQAATFIHGQPHEEETIGFLQALCNRLEVELIIGRGYLASTVSEGTMREARYNWLSSITNGYIAVGHNANDQAETVLMHLFRGTVVGMGGMPQERELNDSCRLIRPLLDTTREEILAFLNAKNQPYLEDPTNLDTKYLRNFIRHELMPRINSRFPSVVKTLCRTARNFSEDEKFLQELAGEHSPKENIINRKEFLSLEKPLKRRVIKKFIETQTNKMCKGSVIDSVLDLTEGKISLRDNKQLIVTKEEIKCTIQQ
jgi:tRNA(Ile)-lysidine synthase